MKKRYFVTKTIWQIFLYAFELISISLLLTWLSTLFTNCHSSWEYIERFIACYTIYQLLVLIILNTINDIAKDSCLAYISNLKMTNLYVETNDKNLKIKLLKNIDRQLDVGTINNNKYRELYKELNKYINKPKLDNNSYIKYELIKAEHNYEFISLQWRYSFLLRLFKNRKQK